MIMLNKNRTSFNELLSEINELNDTAIKEDEIKFTYVGQAESKYLMTVTPVKGYYRSKDVSYNKVSLNYFFNGLKPFVFSKTTLTLNEVFKLFTDKYGLVDLVLEDIEPVGSFQFPEPSAKVTVSIQPVSNCVRWLPDAITLTVINTSQPVTNFGQILGEEEGFFFIAEDGTPLALEEVEPIITNALMGEEGGFLADEENGIVLKLE